MNIEIHNVTINVYGGAPTISNKEKVADDQAVTKDVCNSEPNSSEIPKSSIKPEDVPPNEPWLIEVNGWKAVGTRYAGHSTITWSVAALDGSFAVCHSDSEVTLIHKLVAETHALPEGMRLADHETYGRVVVAPRANTHGEESFYRTNEDISWGASHGSDQPESSISWVVKSVPEQDVETLAVAVGVLQPEPELDPLQEELERYNRAGERLTAIAFGVVVGTGLLWAYLVSLMP